MGFWARLFGREVDTTVTDYQAQVPVGRSIGGPFSLTVEDVFVIQGRGTVATGKVELGTVSVGDVLEWRHPDGRSLSASVSALEAFRKTLDTAGPGELIGVLFAGVERGDLPPGTVLGRP
jgi:elongation factor Tu